MTRNWIAAGLVAATLLAGCKPRAEERADAGNAADNAAEAADPALTGALADQIMVDPTLSQQANGKAARPAAQPAQAPVPPASALAANAPAPVEAPAGSAKTPPARPVSAAPGQERPTTMTLGQLAGMQRQTANAAPARTAAAAKGCGNSQLGYSAAWAAKLPAALPIYPGGQLAEAAGTDAPGCGLRVVSFRTTARWETVLDWYNARAAKAGWATEHQLRGGDHVLAGTRNGPGAFLLILADKGAKGSDVDLVVSADR